MLVEIKGNKLIITADINDLQKLPDSTTGKTLIVFSTHGNIPTACIVNGKPLVVSINAYVKKDKK